MVKDIEREPRRPSSSQFLDPIEIGQLSFVLGEEKVFPQFPSPPLNVMLHWPSSLEFDKWTVAH